MEAQSRRLAHVAAHARQLGIQPAQSDQPQQRRADEDDVDARHGARQRAGSHAADLQRRDVPAEPERPRAGDRRQDRRPALAIPAQAASGSRQVHAGLRHQPQPRDLRRQDHRHECRRLRLRARRKNRCAGLGNEDPRLPERRAADVGADHRQRQDHLRPRLRARRRPRCLRDYRARCRDRQGDLAHAHDSEARRTGI